MVDNQFKLNLPKYAEIKIANIVATGKYNFKKFLGFEDINYILQESCFGWYIINQETTPQLCAYIIREDESKVYFQLWHTGRFYLAGTRSEKEVELYFNEILKELRRLVPKVFENNKK